MNTPRTLIFIGPQASGKGTQAKLLAQKINGLYIGTGSMFRKIAKEDTEFGRYIKEVLDSGALVSDKDVEEMLRENLDSTSDEQRVIFDGVPRRLSQAEFLVNYMKSLGKDDIATFYIKLSREEAISRMSARRVCVACDAAHKIADPENIKDCIKCGGKLVQRADDMPEAIQKRLDIYYHDTLPVLDYLKEHSNFYEIDGTKSIEDVQNEINQTLGITG
ncbi:MAG: adenylate kinase [Candidatus Doudnabacteria bacterium]|nr:adenylate kinase [Candidatus Doudnabacteria bacterium]